MQITDAANQQKAKAIVWRGLQPDVQLRDRFFGMGDFSLPAGKFVQIAVGVASIAALGQQAAYNANLNNLKNISLFLH